jgi:hypothetical protein
VGIAESIPAQYKVSEQDIKRIDTHSYKEHGVTPQKGVNFAMIHRLHYKYLNSYLSLYHFYMSKPLEKTVMKGAKGGKQTHTKSQTIRKVTAAK